RVADLDRLAVGRVDPHRPGLAAHARLEGDLPRLDAVDRLRLLADGHVARAQQAAHLEDDRVGCADARVGGDAALLGDRPSAVRGLPRRGYGLAGRGAGLAGRAFGL